MSIGDYRPIGDYGLIGDLHTVALVGRNGSIDFMCFPHFDSPSIFAALLDDEKGGRFQIAPLLEDVSAKQLYLPDTNVLLTRFLSDDGVAEIVDFMPVEEVGHAHTLIRQIRTIRGELRFRMQCAPRFDYARARHGVERTEDSEIIFRSRGEDETVLRFLHSIPVDVNDGDVVAEFTLGAGHTAEFILEDAALRKDEATRCDAGYVGGRFEATRNYWRGWIARCQYDGPLAGDGEPLGAGAEAADLAGARVDRGGAHLRPARGDRR